MTIRRSWKRVVKRVMAIVWMAMGMTLAGAQVPAGVQVLPELPGTPRRVPDQQIYDWFSALGYVCGVGASQTTPATTPTAQCGGMLRIEFLQLEAGVMGPQAGHSSVSGYLSADAWIPLLGVRRRSKVNQMPFLLGGYTRLFETGHALDYGVGYAVPVSADHALQFEARDYWTFANPHQHNVVLRVAWVLGLPDV